MKHTQIQKQDREIDTDVHTDKQTQTDRIPHTRTRPSASVVVCECACVRYNVMLIQRINFLGIQYHYYFTCFMSVKLLVVSRALAIKVLLSRNLARSTALCMFSSSCCERQTYNFMFVFATKTKGMFK